MPFTDWWKDRLPPADRRAAKPNGRHQSLAGKAELRWFLSMAAIPAALGYRYITRQVDVRGGHAIIEGGRVRSLDRVGRWTGSWRTSGPGFKLPLRRRSPEEEADIFSPSDLSGPTKSSGIRCSYAASSSRPRI